MINIPTTNDLNIVDYWNKASMDDDVDNKYICDIDVDLCLKDIGYMAGTTLEIGCGVGRLMKRGDYGIDISLGMLGIAKRRKPECTFAHTVDGVIPFNNNTFDNVYCYLVFQHLKPDSIQSYMNETYRVLKLGGKFTFQFIPGTEREPLSNHYSVGQMTLYMERAGFKDMWTKPSVAHKLWQMMGATKE